MPAPLLCKTEHPNPI
ncbi:hypothetical protein Zm00014a_039280 [Zea mays]|uniref:Uncharacterized protein n=1 Tax=Zea mays TaxID=4577 RepID=A0A317YBQ1_MAIZE|nr:hypothetical protein Zm00014a_039280 [Zea mays]